MIRDCLVALTATLLFIGDVADSILNAGRWYCGLVQCELTEDESEELSRW